MELRDNDLVLRSWTEDDVPALVAACNDPEISRWIPLIPSPYTEEDARTFVLGHAQHEDYSLAITRHGALVGRSASASTGLAIGVASGTGLLPRRGEAAFALAPCACSRGGRSTSWPSRDSS